MMVCVNIWILETLIAGNIIGLIFLMKYLSRKVNIKKQNNNGWNEE